MAQKHRKRSRTAKRFATVGAAAATASALTVGAVQVVDASGPANIAEMRDVALTAGPQYTQIITDWSSTVNNLLFISGEGGDGVEDIWNALANAIPGGLLPTFTSDTEQEDLTSLAGLVAALGSFAPLPVPNLDGIPGLPAGSDLAATAGLLPGLLLADLGLVAPVAVDVLALGLGIPVVLGLTNALVTLYNNTIRFNTNPITGIPTVEDLTGLTVTETTSDSAYDWPLFGLGPILGLSGETHFGNTFAQLPQLVGTELITSVLSGLNGNGTPITANEKAAIELLLTPLAALNTPSLTVWTPSGQGNYGLPFGGSLGWLATMPTVAVGPFSLAGLPLSTTETVAAIPIFAGGINMPLNLGSFGQVISPGVLFPTATGVSAVGGTVGTSWSIPLLGFSWTSFNIPLLGTSASYIGTNGINFSGGSSLGVLTTPFGTYPILYSPGKFNVGSTGFGFTGPSLFTIGLGPSFQVGTAPTQQSPDGLIPASVLNPFLEIPTQLGDLQTLLGLPDVGGAVADALLTPAFNALVAPIGASITNLLNDAVGPVSDGIASFNERVTSALANLLGAGPSPAQSIAPFSAAKVADSGPLPSPTLIPDLSKGIDLKSVELPKAGGLDLLTTGGNAELKKKLQGSSGGLEAAVEKARGQSAERFKKAKSKLDAIAEDGRQQIERTVKEVGQNINKAADNAKGGSGPVQHIVEKAKKQQAHPGG